MFTDCISLCCLARIVFLFSQPLYSTIDFYSFFLIYIVFCTILQNIINILAISLYNVIFPCNFLVFFNSLHFSLQMAKIPFARRNPCKWKHCLSHLQCFHVQGFFLAKGNIAICKEKCKEMKLARKLQGNCKNIRNIFKKT